MNRSPTSIALALASAVTTLAATSPTPRLDAELLLAHTLGWPRARLLAEGRAPLNEQQLNSFEQLIARRAELEPVAYLVGHKEFYGLDFIVDRRVLVPRPETELLVDLALQRARAMLDAGGAGEAALGIADIGTGSGCIAIALAAHLPAAQVSATDCAPDALAVARMNAERHGLDARLKFLLGDLLAPISDPIDLLVSNPPYTILDQIDEGVRRHEPRGALDGGPDGLDLYRQLLAQAPAKLRPGGAALLEIGATQGRAVADLARRAFPRAVVRIYQDLAGLDRVVAIDDRERGVLGSRF